MKVFMFSVFFLFLNWSVSYSGDQIEEAVMDADSLFNARKYTEAFKLYQHLLEVERKSSPAMLLKMAYIKEGLGDYTNALYYLNLYYLQTADKQALRKMEELAEKKDLQGYDFNDIDFVKTIFYKYFNTLLFFLGSLAVLLLALMFYYKRKSDKKPVLTGIMMVLVLAVLFYTLNFGKDYHKGIVTTANTYVMGGPSAGAEVIGIIGKGHRIPLYGQHDVWTRTEWKGENAFIKADRVTAISFFDF